AMYLISSARPAGRSFGSRVEGSPAAASESCEANTERSAVSNPAASRFATARWKCSRSGNEATASRMTGKDAELSAMPILSFVVARFLMLPSNTLKRRLLADERPFPAGALAGDGPIPRNQGGEPRLSAVLPDGR